MVIGALFLWAQAAQTPVPPVERLCLLAGPSRSLIAMKVVPDGNSYAVHRIEGQAWPFSADSLRLRSASVRDSFEARDEAANLYARYQLFMADRGGVNLEINRGVDTLESLPLLHGSCVEPDSAPAAEYLRQARDPSLAPPPNAEDLRARPLSASRHCQVVSAAGWVSRFSFEFAANSDAVTISSADRSLWRSTVATTRLGLPPLPDPKWIRFGFYFPSAADVPHSINTFWVHSTPDGSQSSMSASFFGYDPDGPISNEDVAGVCVAFVGN